MSSAPWQFLGLILKACADLNPKIAGAEANELRNPAKDGLRNTNPAPHLAQPGFLC